MTSFAERLLARQGRTVDDLPKNSNIGRAFRTGVRACSEFQRIDALPRRNWESDPRGAWLVERLTEHLKTPNGSQSLRPIQAVVLSELYERRGGIGAVPVGGGKTLIAALAPALLELSPSLFLAPANLLDKTNKAGKVFKRGKTEKEFERLKAHWKIVDYTRMLSYEKLSNVKHYAGILDEIAPKLIVLEEGHHVKNVKSVRVRVLRAYLKKHPDTVVLDLTGTWSRNSVKDGAHIAEWCLGAHSPFPRSFSAIEEWAAALDEEVESRLGPGALASWTGIESPSLDQVRAAVGKRVAETPGFVTLHTQDFTGSLVIQGEPFNGYGPEVDKYFTNLRGSWETPDGVAFTEPSQLASYLRQCQTEFFYYQDPPPPEDWKQARKVWACFVRETLHHNKQGLISEYQVANACAQGRLDSFGVYEEWQKLRPSYDYEKSRRVSWFGTKALEWVAAWMEEHKGVVFTPYVAVGKKLQELTKLPYFASLGQDPVFGSIDDFAGGPCIASIQANKEGRNLQDRWSRALLLGGSPNAELMEQLVGRLHRFGQKADEVVFDVFFGCAEAVEAVWRARSEAEWGKHMNSHAFAKMLVADILLPTEVEVSRWKGPRWEK